MRIWGWPSHAGSRPSRCRRHLRVRDVRCAVTSASSSVSIGGAERRSTVRLMPRDALCMRHLRATERMPVWRGASHALAKRRPVTGASPRPPAQRRLHGGDAERHLCILWACGPGSDGPHRCSEIESRPRNVIHQAKLCERALEALPAPALSAASHQKRHVPICPRDPRRPHFPAARSPP